MMPSDPAATGSKTYHGSCFCGAVEFEADGDLAQGTMRCNCRFCRKMRYWEMRLPDADGFRVTHGTDALAQTPRQQNDGVNMQHYFCATCGTRLWTQGDVAEMGGRFVMVCIGALDGISEQELSETPVFYADGAHDNWWNPAPEIRYL